MKRLIILSILLKLSVISYAQQDPAFSLYLQNKLLFNPAAAGTDNKHVAHVQARRQWHKIDGPKTAIASYHTYFKNANSGFGALVMADEVPFIRNRSFSLAYSYRFNFEQYKNTYLQLGASAGLTQIALTSVDFVYRDPNDPIIPKQTSVHTRPDFGAGLWWQFNKGFASAAISHLTKPHFPFTAIGGYTMMRSANFMAGYEHTFAKEWTVQPLIFSQTMLNMSATTLETDVIFTHKNRLITGYGYRFLRKNTNPLKAQFGYRFKDKLEARVAIDVPRNFSVFGSSTEGVLMFKF